MVLIMADEDKTGRERKERLRVRRDEAGLAQVSGWVPKNRRAYARQVLAALSQGSNSLPPDPEQAAALAAALAAAEAAKAKEEVAHASLAAAEQREQVLVAELNAARADNETTREVGRRVEVAAVARVEAAERLQKATAVELQVASTAVAQARAEVEQFRQIPGLRGYIVRRLSRKAKGSKQDKAM